MDSLKKRNVFIGEDEVFNITIVDKGGNETTYYDCRINYVEGKEESDYYTIAIAAVERDV